MTDPPGPPHAAADIPHTRRRPTPPARKQAGQRTTEREERYTVTTTRPRLRDFERAPWLPLDELKNERDLTARCAAERLAANDVKGARWHVVGYPAITAEIRRVYDSYSRAYDEADAA